MSTDEDNPDYDEVTAGASATAPVVIADRASQQAIASPPEAATAAANVNCEVSAGSAGSGVVIKIVDGNMDNVDNETSGYLCSTDPAIAAAAVALGAAQVGQEVAREAPEKKKRLCRFPGCMKVIKSQGHCQRHGAQAKRCKVSGCDKQAQGTHEGEELFGSPGVIYVIINVLQRICWKHVFASRLFFHSAFRRNVQTSLESRQLSRKFPGE